MNSIIIILVFVLASSCLSAQHDWEIINTDITEDLHDVEFINDSVGFIYSYGSGNIYKTADEGKSWIKCLQTDSIYFEQLQFINDDTGWICGEQGKVLKTIDCGKTWNDLSIHVKDKNLLLYGMCFINDTTAYLSGAILADRKMTPIAFKTVDGGISWNVVFEDIPKMILNFDKKGTSLFATGNGVIIRIELKTDTWEYVYKDTLKLIGQIRDIDFSDDNFGLAVSFNGKGLKTTDGGQSFEYFDITSNRLRSIAFTGDNKWIAAGDNNKNDAAVIHTSNDSGKTWQKNNDFPDIHRICFTDENIWIVGKKGIIAKQKK